MKNGFYFSGIRSVTLALADMFTDVEVKKLDENGSIVGSVDVPVKLGIKEKFGYGLNDKKQEVMFPVMGLHLTQLQYDSNRATAKLEKIYLGENPVNKKTRETLNPSPGRITYQLTIASKFVVEAEQILEQILPFFNPFIVINITLPEIDGSYDAKVILGTVSPETETTISQDGTRPVSGNLELTVDCGLFKPVNDISLIEKIITQLIKDPGKKLLAQHILDGTADPITSKGVEKDFYLGLPK